MKRNIRRRILDLLTNLRFAIVLLLIIASVTILGTVIEQEQSLDFYQTNYPAEQPIFGIFSWKVIFFFGIDHLYSNVWFYSLLLLFGCSLLFCTFSTQLPLLKVARTWKFLIKKYQFTNLSLSLVLQNLLNRSQCIFSLNNCGYFVFHKKDKFYGYKGLVGRISPIFVHCSLICILIGSVVSAFTGFIVQEVVPQGEYFHVQNLVSAGNLSFIPQDLLGKVNNFRISYNNNGSINQFFSTLSISDSSGSVVKEETIYVNKPLRYRGIAIYQTDWNVTGLRLSVNMQQLQLSVLPNVFVNQKNIWVVPFKTGRASSDKYLFIVRDLQGEFDIYTDNFTFLSTQRVGESFVLGGINVKVLDIISSTGLQIKSDPGIPIVYLGFFVLILSSFLSYLTYSQVWLTSFEHVTSIGGNSNRDIVNFEEEFYLLSSSFSEEEQSL